MLNLCYGKELSVTGYFRLTVPCRAVWQYPSPTLLLYCGKTIVEARWFSRFLI